MQNAASSHFSALNHTKTNTLGLPIKRAPWYVFTNDPYVIHIYHYPEK